MKRVGGGRGKATKIEAHIILKVNLVGDIIQAILIYSILVFDYTCSYGRPVVSFPLKGG